MCLLNAGSGGCCLRWSATASGGGHCQVGDGRNGRQDCGALVLVCCLGDGSIVLAGSLHKSRPHCLSGAAGFVIVGLDLLRTVE